MKKREGRPPLTAICPVQGCFQPVYAPPRSSAEKRKKKRRRHELSAESASEYLVTGAWKGQSGWAPPVFVQRRKERGEVRLPSWRWSLRLLRRWRADREEKKVSDQEPTLCSKAKKRGPFVAALCFIGRGEEGKE